MLTDAALEFAASMFGHRRRRTQDPSDPSEPPVVPSIDELPRRGERWQLRPDGTWATWSYLDDRWEDGGRPPADLPARSPAPEPLEWWRNPSTDRWQEGPPSELAAPPPPPPPPPSTPLDGATPAPPADAPPALPSARAHPARPERPLLPTRTVAAPARTAWPLAAWAGSSVASAAVVLGAADVLRWIAWMLRAAGPFLIGNDVIPAPPSYPPSPNAETVVLLTFCTACMVLSIRLAAAIAGRAGPRRFRGRSTDRVG